MGRPARLLGPALLLSYVEFAALPASAQAPAQNQGLVVRDGTLGSAPAGVVAPGLDDLGTADYLIRADLGEQRDRNLFHSFERFSIGSGERATFTGDGAPDPGAIENVISRVTGNEPSEIHGMLHSTIPAADVWLLNPNGVMFGAGAQLEVPGSFHASTGDSVGFDANGLERFYSDPSRPSVLSTATPLGFGFLSEKGAALLVVDRSVLDVPDGETLELVGGDVSLTRNAALTAPGGDVRLEAQGEVRISQSLVDVSKTADAPGTISIRGGRIVVEKSSLVRAENESSVPTSDSAQPEISLEARKSVLVDASLLSASTHGAGNAGTIDVASPEITVNQGLGFDPLAPPEESRAGLRAETTSSGAAGKIELRADDLVALANGIGVSASAAGPDVTGDAGSVAIGARKLEVKQGSYVSAETAGTGDGGTISISAGDSVLVDDSLLSVNTWSTGNAGTIRIAGLGEGFPSPDVTIQNGPGLPSVDIPRVTERGVRAETRGDGAGGTIEIDARGLVVAHGVSVSADSVGTHPVVAQRGDAGDITIHADSVHLSDRSFIATGGWGSTGKVGTLTIDLGAGGSLVVDGETKATQVPRPLYAPRYAWILAKNGGTPGSLAIRGDASVEVKNGGFIGADSQIGDGGTITLDVHSLELHSGGGIGAGTSGTGKGGTITVRAGSLVMANGPIDAGSGGSGDAGTITIDADSVFVGDEAGIRATSWSFGGGKAGTIVVHANVSIVLKDAGEEAFSLAAVLQQTNFRTGVFSTTIFGGDGGDITLDAPEISLLDGAIVSTSTIGGGKAGNIFLNAERILVENGSFVDSTTLLTPASAGNVSLTALESIEVMGRHPVDLAGSRVSSGTLSEGAAGSVTLDAPRIVLDEGGVVSTAAVPLDSSFMNSKEGGAGGQIKLVAERELLVRNGAVVTASSVSSVGTSNAGSIDIEAGSVRVEGAGSNIESFTGGDGAGGDVVVRASRIAVAKRSQISARSAALGHLPDGTPDWSPLGPVIASVAALLKDPPRDANGHAGAVQLLDARTIRVIGGRITTSAADTNGGSIDLQATKLVHLDAGVIEASVIGGTGGNITIDPEVVLLENGSRIGATAAEGRGGRIQITADNYFAFPDSSVDASAGDPDFSGIVEVHTPDVDLAGNLTELPNSYLDAGSLMRERCAARARGESAGSFAVRGAGGIPPEPDGWLRARVEADTDETAEAAPALPLLTASVSGPLLAAGACE